MKIVPNMLMRTTLLALSLLISSIAASSDMIVASWNLERLGHRSQQSFPALASVAGLTDLLAVQEVLTEQGLNNLEIALEEKQTGESWSTLVSHAIDSNSYKDMYTFVWRDKTVKYEEGALVYLDQGNRFIRKPFSAKPKLLCDDSSLTLGTVRPHARSALWLTTGTG